ncbi:heparinase II/III family protein [Thermaurantiacus sp.]
MHRRSDDGRGPSLVERISDRLAEAGFRSPIHRMRLKGRFPLKLLGVPEDPVPGDADRGARLMAGRLYHGGYGVALATGALDLREAPGPWRRWVHGWGWLRDAAAHPPANAAEAQRIETLARRWLERFPDYDTEAWAPDLTGRRIMMALAHAPLLIPRHDHVHRSAVLNAIARWTRHLDQVVKRMPDGPARRDAVAGLFAGALLIPGQDDRLARAEALLAHACGELLAAGNAPPLELAALGDTLLLLAACHAARGARVSSAVAGGLERVRARLAALLMGDGMPAPWHGGQPSPAQMARLGIAPDDSALAQDPGGYVRLTGGSCVVVMDASPPPSLRQTKAPHASTLAFVMSDGAVPVIVSCGGAFRSAPEGLAPLALPDVLADALRATAAHSTLVLDDCNSTRLTPAAGRRSVGVEEVAVELRRLPQGTLVEAVHDGYRGRFGLLHQRRLWLAADGSDLRGEDRLLPASGVRRLIGGEAVPVAVRFHLAPGAVASLTEDGSGALIRIAGARPRDAVAWSFRARLPPGFRLSIDESVTVDWQGEVRATRQLVLLGAVSRAEPPALAWALRRQSRR